MTDTAERDIRLILGRVDGKLDILLTRSDLHDKRIASLEAWKNRAWGYFLAGGFAGGAAAPHLFSLLQS